MCCGLSAVHGFFCFVSWHRTLRNADTAGGEWEYWEYWECYFSAQFSWGPCTPAFSKNMAFSMAKCSSPVFIVFIVFPGGLAPTMCFAQCAVSWVSRPHPEQFSWGPCTPAFSGNMAFSMANCSSPVFIVFIVFPGGLAPTMCFAQCAVSWVSRPHPKWRPHHCRSNPPDYTSCSRSGSCG